MPSMRSQLIPADTQARFVAAGDDSPRTARPRSPVAKANAKPEVAVSGRFPVSASRAWPEIRARLRGAHRGAILLDFDGTLVNLRRRPSDVRMAAEVRRVLQRLVGHTNLFVAIVSGRKVRNLRELIHVEGLHYFGVHGGEMGGKSARLTKKARFALEGAKHAARLQLGVIEGIWIEDKRLSFSVHYREADAAAAKRGQSVLFDLLAPWGDALHVLNGSRVWEILPIEIPGKSSVIEEVLSQLPVGATVVYIGDDSTDEMAFAVLPDQITVRVGRAPATSARYLLRDPADVLRFLARLEKELP
jgi:trehalose 6-phosphate phosphatase